MRKICFAAGLLAPLLTITAVAQIRGSLSEQDLAEATRLGEDGDPAPYLINHSSRNSSRVNRAPDVVLAAIYTPFVRAAFAARAARLAPSSILSPPAANDPLVYVALRWYCCDIGTTRESFDPRRMPLPEIRIAREPTDGRSPYGGDPLRPVWVKPGPGALQTFGADPPYDDIALVAAFQPEAFVRGRMLVASKATPANQFGLEGTSLRTSSFALEKVDRWR